ncbi:MAG: hypothetical protein ACR2IV_22320 [Bryobacteraceae bacterium]
MSEKKSENPTRDSIEDQPFPGIGSREHLVKDLRTKAERFSEQASLEQIIELR